MQPLLPLLKKKKTLKLFAMMPPALWLNQIHIGTKIICEVKVSLHNANRIAIDKRRCILKSHAVFLFDLVKEKQG
jgi:hypothetical protein